MPLKLRRRIDPRYWLASFVVIATIAAALTAWTLEPNLEVPSLEVPSATDELLRHVKFLASAELTGRGVDTPGIKLAGDYIAADFAKSGLQPGGDNGSFRQPFDVAVGVTVVEPSSLTLGNSTAATKRAMDSAWPVDIRQSCSGGGFCRLRHHRQGLRLR